MTPTAAGRRPPRSAIRTSSPSGPASPRWRTSGGGTSRRAGRERPSRPRSTRQSCLTPRLRRASSTSAGSRTFRCSLPPGSTARGPLGFDCGPANGLLDAWARRHLDAPFDEDGDWAARGAVHEPLLERMLADPFFSQPASEEHRARLFRRGLDRPDRPAPVVAGRSPGRRAADPVRAHRRDGRGFHPRRTVRKRTRCTFAAAGCTTGPWSIACRPGSLLAGWRGPTPSAYRPTTWRRRPSPGSRSAPSRGFRATVPR